ncbi:MAG: class II fructose-bisphosphate aldolase [Candidatus Paceibacterota bacterium]
MKTLREYIAEAENKKVAIGHFNISDSEGFWAVVAAARALDVPAIIGVSEGERDFIGVEQVAAMVKSAREKLNFPIFLNADHSYSFERVKEAVDAGFDAVIFDGAKLSTEENIATTKRCVEYARSVNPGIIVEAELGYIGQSSKILDAVPEGVSLTNLTTPEEAKKFVEATGVDLFAPAVGNIHGMIRGGGEPALHPDLVKEIRAACGVPLVLHGGSGTSDDDFKKAISAGISIVHINTELRLAYRNGIRKSLQESPDEIAPYKFMKEPVKEMSQVVEKRLKLFNNL